MRNKASNIEVARCRAGMAELLTNVIETTHKIERRLKVSGGWRGSVEEIDINADPTEAIQIEGALLLRKARIHTTAVLRANESRNLHSLAVQMRTVLECAGQVVFKFRTLFIAPGFLTSKEEAIAMLGTRVNVDFYQTLRRATKGQSSPKELRKAATKAEAAAAEEFRAAKPKRQKTWRFSQVDKVSTLSNGHEWYGYLSEYFGHGSAVDWRGPSSRGGVLSIDTAEDEFAMLGMMAYLVAQVAQMNAAAALCPVKGDGDDRWERWVEPTLAQLNDARESSKELRRVAKAAATRGNDGSTRTD